MALQRRYNRSINWFHKVTCVVLTFWVVSAISHPPVPDNKDVVDNEIDHYVFFPEQRQGEQSYGELISLIKSASDKPEIKLCLALPLLFPYDPSNNALNAQAVDPGSQLLTALRIAVVYHIANGLVATVQSLTDSSEAFVCFSSASIALFADFAYIALHPTGRFDSERLSYSESISVISKSLIITGLFLKALSLTIEDQIIRAYIDEDNPPWAQSISKLVLSGVVMLLITPGKYMGVFNPDINLSKKLIDSQQWSHFQRSAVLFQKIFPEAASVTAAYMAYSGSKDMVHSGYNFFESVFEAKDPTTQKVICSGVTTLILSSLSYRLMTYSPTSGFPAVFLANIVEASGFGASEFLADISEKMNLGEPVFNDLLGLALQLELFIFIKTQASPDSKYHNIYAGGVLLPLMISGIQTVVMNSIATVIYTAMHSKRVLRGIVFFFDPFRVDISPEQYWRSDLEKGHYFIPFDTRCIIENAKGMVTESYFLNNHCL